MLVKGGHLESGDVIDLLFDGSEWHQWTAARVATTSTHGTGCTLSAGIAAGLAQGRGLVAAVEAALVFTRRALESAPGLGGGSGPLNHWALVPPPEEG